MLPFTEDVIDIISSIPKGRVATYGQIASLAGSPRAARQVARILHSMSHKYDLPWHRVISSKGEIVIKDPEGAQRQRELLQAENIEVSENLRVDLEEFQWVVEY